MITVTEGWSPDMRAKADGFQRGGENGKALEESIPIKRVTHSISSQGIRRVGKTQKNCKAASLGEI